MCEKLYTACWNHKCTGAAQILKLIPCKNRPNCKIEYTRVPTKRHSVLYCLKCSTMTPQERKRQTTKDWHAAYKEANSAKVQRSQRNGADDSVHGGVEQQAESSTTGERRGALGDGLLLNSDDPFSISEDTEERFLHPGKDEFSRSNLFAFLQNQRRTNGEVPSTNLFSDVTRGPQGNNPDSFPPACHDIPRFVDSSLARASKNRCLYGNPADTVPKFSRTQTNVPSTPQQEHQQPKTPSPTLTEIIDSTNTELDGTLAVNVHNLPRDYATGPDATPLSYLSNSPPIFPGPSNQIATNPLTATPPSSQIPIDPALLYIDTIFANGGDFHKNMQDAQKFLRDQGLWPESSDSK